MSADTVKCFCPADKKIKSPGLMNSASVLIPFCRHSPGFSLVCLFYLVIREFLSIFISCFILKSPFLQSVWPSFLHTPGPNQLISTPVLAVVLCCLGIFRLFFSLFVPPDHFQPCQFCFLLRSVRSTFLHYLCLLCFFVFSFI